MSHSRPLPRPTLGSAEPVLALVGVVLALGAFVYWTPIHGPLYQPTLLPSRLPLKVTEADPLVVLASIGIGQNWLYLTGISAALLVAGLLLATVGSRLGTAFGTPSRAGRPARWSGFRAVTVGSARRRISGNCSFES